MWSDYDTGARLAVLIQRVIEEYSSDRQAPWAKGGPDDERSLAFVDDLAAQIMAASDQLVAPSARVGPLDWAGIQVLLNDADIAQPILEKIEILLAERFAADTDSMAARCRQIAGELIRAHPNQSVMRFMRRLSRCYVGGFLPECVMLCRAVLENAVDEVIQSKGVDVPPGRTGKISMNDKVSALGRREMISHDGQANAITVWKRGSKAIHNDPHVTVRVFETVRMTLSLLSELYDR